MSMPFYKINVYDDQGNMHNFFGRYSEVCQKVRKFPNALIHKYGYLYSLGGHSVLKSYKILSHFSCKNTFFNIIKIKGRVAKPFMIVLYANDILLIKHVKRVPRKYMKELHEIKNMLFNPEQIDFSLFDQVIKEPCNKTLDSVLNGKA